METREMKKRRSDRSCTKKKPQQNKYMHKSHKDRARQIEHIEDTAEIHENTDLYRPYELPCKYLARHNRLRNFVFTYIA